MRRTVILLAVVVAALIPAAPPASAASLGTLTVTPASGTVDGSPMFTEAVASGRCPTGYETSIGLLIGRTGAPLSTYRPVARVAGADTGDFIPARPALKPNKSMLAALRPDAVTDGSYTLLMLCTSESNGDHPDMFSAAVEVTGSTWTVVTGGGPAPTPTVAPTTSPPGAGPTGGTGTNVTIDTSIAPKAGGDLPRTGTGVARIAAAGAGLVVAGVVLRGIVRRRRLR